MSTAEFEMMMVFMGFIASGVFGLVGLRMFLTHRARRLSGGQAGTEQLAETVDDLRRELGEVRGDLADMQERMDFAERLLTRAREEGRLDPGR